MSKSIYKYQKVIYKHQKVIYKWLKSFKNIYKLSKVMNSMYKILLWKQRNLKTMSGCAKINKYLN